VRHSQGYKEKHLILLQKMAAYETYETDKDYDTMEMENTSAAERAPVATPPVKKRRGHKKFKIIHIAILVVIVLLLGGAVGLLLKSYLEEPEVPVDCDVGPWGEWTSCYLPPDMCGVGSKDRSREQIAEAQHHGEKCAKPRIIELMESQACNVECKSPVDCKVGPWEEWSSCSVTCGEGTRERGREKLADAAHNGEMCSSTRIISLTEQDTCNEQPCEIVVLRRKEVGNPKDYFDKSFEEYEYGFESKGEKWIGLKKLHLLTYAGKYGLKVTLKDFDNQTYHAVYAHFSVGDGEGYELSVSGFNASLSTLGDSLAYHNGMKFSAKDRDQDTYSGNCAAGRKGGGWFKACLHAHLTGLHTTSSTHLSGGTQIHWNHCGDKCGGGTSWNSWKEAEMILMTK